MNESTTPSEVLVVEDNPGDARLIRHHLQRDSSVGTGERTELTHVETLAAAVEELEDGTYDVVFLDLGLEETTGLETLNRLLDRDLDVPVVVLTGLDDHELAVEAIQAGAQDYLVKDEIDTRTLERSLRYAIERGKQERELRRQTEQMEFFNSLLRHDMLNDMQVIRSRGQMLAAELDGDRAEKAETVVEWSDDVIDLTRTVRSVLDTVTAGDQSNLHRVAVAEVLEAEAERVRSMGDGVTVDLSVEDGLAVRADDLLGDVLGNLLSNAVGHHDRDDPTLEVEAWRRDGTVVVTVSDDGPGIPEADRERVRERGETGDRGNTGFGLYFVDTMVDAYGGSIELTDADPRGTVVRVELPAY